MRVVVLYNAVPRRLAIGARRLGTARCRGPGLGSSRSRALPVPVRWTSKLPPRRIRDLGRDVVFNLVESMAGSDWLSFMVTGLLDSLRLPYTGSPTEAMFLTAHKLLAKERLCQAGLPTPAWIAADEEASPAHRTATGTVTAAAWIIKSVSEHASLGLDEDSRGRRRSGRRRASAAAANGALGRGVVCRGIYRRPGIQHRGLGQSAGTGNPPARRDRFLRLPRRKAARGRLSGEMGGGFVRV